MFARTWLRHVLHWNRTSFLTHTVCFCNFHNLFLWGIGLTLSPFLVLLQSFWTGVRWHIEKYPRIWLRDWNISSSVPNVACVSSPAVAAPSSDATASHAVQQEGRNSDMEKWGPALIPKILQNIPVRGKSEAAVRHFNTLIKSNCGMETR